MRNDLAFNVSSEAIFTAQNKEHLLSKEEMQNSYVCQKLEEDARLPHACLSQANIPNFINEQNRCKTSSQHKGDVTNEGRLVEYFSSNTVLKFQ